LRFFLTWLYEAGSGRVEPQQSTTDNGTGRRFSRVHTLCRLRAGQARQPSLLSAEQPRAIARVSRNDVPRRGRSGACTWNLDALGSPASRDERGGQRPRYLCFRISRANLAKFSAALGEVVIHSSLSVPVTCSSPLLA
jgi:hypothetical protein